MLACALVVGSCCTVEVADDPAPPEAAQTNAAYRDAVKAALQAKPVSLHHFDCDQLACRHEPGGDLVELVNWAGGTSLELQPYDIPNDRELWLMEPRQLKDKCAAFGRGDALARRLEQLIGLPPNAGKTHFKLVWVPVAKLQRPCADMSIDKECPATKSADKWFAEQRKRQKACKGVCYPFTGQGYTYDWGASPDHVGVAEYIVRGGTSVEIAELISADELCRAGGGE
jgi:hypothetical protein